MEKAEKRNNIRVPFTGEAVITNGGKPVQAAIQNISTGGILVKTEKPLALKEIEMEITVTGPATNLTIQIEGNVARTEGTSIAIQFKNQSLDSFIHLRNIVAEKAFNEQHIIDDFENISFDAEFHD